MTEWISVKDRLPEFNVRILAIDVDGDIYAVVYVNDPNYEHYFAIVSSGCGCCDTSVEATHWMPLPEPPNG